MSRVECHSEFETRPEEALLQPEILFLGASFDMTDMKNAHRLVRGVKWKWCAPQAALVQMLFHSLCDVWLGIVSAYHQFSSISCVTKSGSLWKDMINIILTRPLLPLGQNTDQVEPTRIPHHGQYCFRTADHLAFNCWGIFMVLEPDLFVLIREIKPGFVQRNKIFPTLVLHGMQQIQEAF
jgi:hypothetical protein